MKRQNQCADKVGCDQEGQVTSEGSSYRPVIHGRDARATMASWHGRPGHVKLDRSVNLVSTKRTYGLFSVSQCLSSKEGLLATETQSHGEKLATNSTNYTKKDTLLPQCSDGLFGFGRKVLVRAG